MFLSRRNSILGSQNMTLYMSLISASSVAIHKLKRCLFVLSKMGHFGDKWLQCDWCGWWGHTDWDEPADMALSDGDGDQLMVFCLRCNELEEPPWYPNNRQRCADWFLNISRGLPNPDHQQAAAEVSRKIAEFLASNTK